MPTALSTPPSTSTVAVPAAPPAGPATGRTLAWTIARASDAVVDVPTGDSRWDVLGPHLTAFVDAARRRAGLPGSPVGQDEDVAPALRLRDLGRLAQATVAHGAATTTTAEVDRRLRSLLLVAVGRGPSGA